MPGAFSVRWVRLIELPFAWLLMMPWLLQEDFRHPVQRGPLNPVTNGRDELVRRKIAVEIVQIGAHSDGTPIRGIFTDITPNSFSWIEGCVKGALFRIVSIWTDPNSEIQGTLRSHDLLSVCILFAVRLRALDEGGYSIVELP
jgi:hypothetical protein